MDPPPPQPPRKRFRVGILFVHGMGEQERGDTISQMGDALTEWLRRWLEGRFPSGDLKILSARLRTAHEGAPGMPDDAVGGAAHASVSIRYARQPGECDPPPGSQAWQLRESWWASSFRPATFMELMGWIVAVGPWIIASQRAGLRQRMASSSLSGLVRLFAQGVAVFLTLAAALVAAAITPLAVTLLLLSLIPIPGLSDVMRSLARNLAGSFGDLLVLVRSPIRFAAMAEQVRRDIVDLSGVSDRVLVVAHSQGSAVAWHAIRREAEGVPSPDATAAEPIVRSPVDQFISFGQAFRKLKALHQLHESGGGRQALSVALALISTVLLGVTLYSALSIAGDAIDAGGDVSRTMGQADIAWIMFAASLGLVLAIQLVLERLVGAHASDVEDEIVREITCVKGQFGDFRWVDLWASADPAPNGPLLARNHADLAGYVTSYKVRNAASTIADHSIYWDNATEFVSAIVFAAASLAPPSAIGVTDPVPPALVEAARLRHRRVSLLAAGRVMLFAVLPVAIYALRGDLQAIGAAILSVLNAIPVLPDWFGGWGPLLEGLLGTVALTVVAVAAWGVLAWAWSGVVRSDERAFFRGDPGAPWSGWAIGWALAAAAVPAIGIAALWLAIGSIGIVVWYVVLVGIGLIAVLLVLSAGGRTLWEAPPAG